MKFSFATKTLSLLYVLIFLQLFCGAFSKPSGSLAFSARTNSTRHKNESHASSHAKPHTIKVAKFDFQYIATPFIVVLWVLLASLLKLGFHLTKKLSKVIPESCMIILLGVALGGLLRLMHYEDHASIPVFNSRIFFLFLLPPIVLEAGYFLHTRAFFDNIGTILLYAVVGTLFNTFTVGLTLYAITDLNITLLQMLLFSCLISAVDPVAVLAVFEEVHVNEVLYILVFGESLLNDAVTVVLYRLFEAFVSQKTIEVEQVFIGIAAFFVVSFGGLIIGVIWAFIAAFLTKYTDHVRVLEPIFIFSLSYMAYLTAELFHFSGIISIVTCAIVMKPYVEANISQKSRIPLKYFMKMASSLSETIIFMLLGVILCNRTLEFHAMFTFTTIIFTFVYRCLGVVLLTWLANKFGRLNELGKVDQFIMAYGGIRGAVAFSLATLIDKEHVHEKVIMETTAIAVVLFTVFVQGTTIKPFVDCLKVKRSVKRKDTMLVEVNDKVMDHMLGGIQEVIQHRGHYYWKNLYQYADAKYLRPWFMRHKYDKAMDETLLAVYRKVSYRDAMMAVERPGLSPTGINRSEEDINQLVVKDRRRSSALAPCERAQSVDNDKFKDINNHVQLAFLLGKPRKGTQGLYRNNVFEETDICDRALRERRHSQPQPPSVVISRSASRDASSSGDENDDHRGRKKRAHKHGHKHSHRNKHQKVSQKLSDIPESPKSKILPLINPDAAAAADSSEPAVKKPADDEHESSASDSETTDLLPTLAEMSSSPTLDTHFFDMDEPTVSVDTRAFAAVSPSDGVDETVM